MSRSNRAGAGFNVRSARTATTAVLVLVGGLWLVGSLLGTAQAHTLDTQGFSEITQEGDDVRYELLVDYAAFAIAAGIGPPGPPSSDHAEEHLSAGRQRAAGYLDGRLHVLVDGVRCSPEISDTGIEPRFDEPYARLSLLYACPGSGEYTVEYTVLVGDLDPGHTNVAGYELGEYTGEFIFDTDNTELTVGDASFVRQAWRFVALGFHHILAGLDHVLFVVALLIGARRMRDVLGVVTVFTVAHSVTLVLTALDVLRVPAAVVEPLIALSIAYVAVTSVLGQVESRYRLMAVFAFGLLHGMGFAGALQVTGDLSWPMVSSLVSFNLGIEAGQALIVAVLLPVFIAVRKLAWSRYLLQAAAALIALAGLTWFVERLVLA